MSWGGETERERGTPREEEEGSSPRVKSVWKGERTEHNEGDGRDRCRG